MGTVTVGAPSASRRGASGRARDGQVRGRALGVVAAGTVDGAGDERVRGALGVGRLAVGDVETLAAYVRDEPFDLAAVVVAAHEAQVERGGRRRRDDVARERARLGARKAVDVERGLVDEFEQRRAAALGPRNAEFLPELFVVGRRFL